MPVYLCETLGFSKILEQVSKAAVANLLITPYFKRFACDPHTELQAS